MPPMDWFRRLAGLRRTSGHRPGRRSPDEVPLVYRLDPEQADASQGLEAGLRETDAVRRSSTSTPSTDGHGEGSAHTSRPDSSTSSVAGVQQQVFAQSTVFASLVSSVHIGVQRPESASPLTTHDGGQNHQTLRSSGRSKRRGKGKDVGGFEGPYTDEFWQTVRDGALSFFRNLICVNFCHLCVDHFVKNCRYRNQTKAAGISKLGLIECQSVIGSRLLVSIAGQFPSVFEPSTLEKLLDRFPTSLPISCKSASRNFFWLLAVLVAGYF